MKKRNLALNTAVASALLALIGSAQAVTVTASPTLFARELLQGSTPNATALTMPVINVVSANGIPVNSTVFVYIKFSGASIATSGAATTAIANVVISNGDGSALAAGNIPGATSFGTSTGTANPTAAGSGVDYLVLQFVTGATAVGIGGTIATLTGATVNFASSAISTPITVVSSVGIGAPATRFGALAASSSSYDALSTATTIATTAQAITVSSAASTLSGLIDLTTTPAAAGFTIAPNANAAVATNAIRLGTVTLANAATAPNIATNAGSYTVATVVPATGATFTVSAAAGFFAALGTTGRINLEATAGSCASTAAVASGLQSPVFATAALAAAATSVTLTSTATPSAAAYSVCMYLPTVSSTSIPLIAGTPSITGVLNRAVVTTDSATNLASSNLYTLALNGSQVDVRMYVPAAVTGYSSFIRVINTGSIAAPVSAQFINADGSIGTSGVLVATLPAGGSTTLSSTAIEAVLGAPVGGVSARPRLRILAPTTGLNIQNQLSNNATGVYTDFNGAQ